MYRKCVICGNETDTTWYVDRGNVSIVANGLAE